MVSMKICSHHIHKLIVSCIKHTETHIPHINITYSHRKFTTVTTPERNNWKRESERMRGSESNRLL